MCKTNVTLLAVFLMLSACSTVETFFEPSEDAVPEKVVAAQPAPELVAFSPSQVETLNDNLRLIRENRAIKARLAAADSRNAELADELARLSKPQVKPVSQSKLLASSADVDIYQRNVDRYTQQKIAEAVKQKGFSPKYPALPNSMGMASKATVFYYDSSFISTAGILAQELAAVLGKPVAVKKGASAFAKNKIIVQIVGSAR